MEYTQGERKSDDFTIFLTARVASDLRAVAAARGLGVNSVVEQALGDLFAIIERCAMEGRDVARTANVELE